MTVIQQPDTLFPEGLHSSAMGCQFHIHKVLKLRGKGQRQEVKGQRQKVIGRSKARGHGQLHFAICHYTILNFLDNKTESCTMVIQRKTRLSHPTNNNLTPGVNF